MLVKVQFPSGRFDEMAEHLANDPRLQKKFGFRIVSTPVTVDELKKEVSEKKEIKTDVVSPEKNKGGRPKKVETKK